MDVECVLFVFFCVPSHFPRKETQIYLNEKYQMTSANNEATNNFKHTCAVHGSCDVITEIKNKISIN